ncbi:MAG: hypothetical protein ACOC80_12435 [Petrotogales bacterium]
MTMYSLTKSGYKAWLEEGHKGSFAEFLISQTTRKQVNQLIQKKIKKLATRDLFSLLNYINENYPYILD